MTPQADSPSRPSAEAASPLEPEELQIDTSEQVDAPADPQVDDDRRALLRRVLRVGYPHARFPDEPYDRAAAAIEAAVADSPEQAQVLADGLADLEGRDFASADDDKATAMLQDVADSPFFAIVHSTTVVALYDQPQVWDLLGYEGPSFDKGGYLHRGFDDLDWLPDPRITEYDGPPRVEVARHEVDEVDDDVQEGTR